MGMILNDGAFFMAGMEEIVEACREAEEGIKALRDKLVGLLTQQCTEAEDAEGDPAAFPTDPNVLERMKAMSMKEWDDTNELRNENIEHERPLWQNAAALARSKMSARAQAFARQMMQQKARQAMKRRKLKHADGSFPDWGCGCVR